MFTAALFTITESENSPNAGQQMEKQNAVHPYQGTLLRHEEPGHRSHRGGSANALCKRRSRTSGSHSLHLQEVARMWNFKQTKCRLGVARVARKGDNEEQLTL